MNISQTAKVYAKALSQIKADSYLIKKDFKEVTESFTGELYKVFDNPSISSEIKQDILKESFKGKISPELYEFLKMLAEKNRIKQLKEIYEAYVQETNIKNNTQEAEITSAIELDNIYKQTIIKKLEEKTNQTIQPHWLISEEIIGGIVIRIGDLVIDTSLKNKIEKLRKQL